MAGPIVISAFNRLGQYASSPGTGLGYAELAVSYPAVANITTSTHFAYPRRDGQDQ